MDLEEWNAALERWFLSEGSNRPVYLAATDSELVRMNDELDLGLNNPAEDLRWLVSLYRYDSLGHLEKRWEEGGTRQAPPWLAYLAATVLIADRQTTMGSLAFYPPLSEFLSVKPRLNEATYGDWFYKWWLQLAAWLESVHAGSRGFPTWQVIPEAGPRCVIGHPYTQILLRREDRIALDQFLAEFSSDHGELIDVADRRGAAKHLVSVLRSWARTGRTLSERVRNVVEGANDAAQESLGYLLLGRLFDRRVETEEQATRQLDVVPMFDEIGRELSIAVIAPRWVSPEQPLRLPECPPIIEPGAPASLPEVEPTSVLLTDGMSEHLEEGMTLRLRGRRVHALAAREWDFWCGVHSVDHGEEVYLLGRHGEASVAGRRAIRSAIKGLPEGWALYGPAPVVDGTETTTVRTRSLIPRRRGGLTLDATSYLVGGEPVIDLAGHEGEVRVDGVKVDSTGREVDLSCIGLQAGAHNIEVGPYVLQFATVAVNQPPTINAAAGSPCRLLSESVLRSRVHLIPRVAEFLLFGVPGESAQIEAGRAPWADHHGLTHAATEPLALSTYPGQDRIVSRLRWFAWQDDDGWAIAELPDIVRAREPLIDPAAWRQATTVIGPTPRVASLVNKPDPAGALQRWQQYCRSDVR